jgi:hypothetical protein
MPRLSRKPLLRVTMLVLATAGSAMSVQAAEPGPERVADHITLKNGFDLICDHRETDGPRVRLYLDGSESNFMEVNASDIASDVPVVLAVPYAPAASSAAPVPQVLTDDQLKPMLAKAGATYDIDADLLASVVRQESAGHPNAVSRSGAQGLMQLMPGTAAGLGVSNSFVPGENIRGGTAYLDALLRRYHEDLALALAAYNAGPAAVDRWHGIPPYRETRVYVARVIHEYNRRYALRRKSQAFPAAQLAVLAH